MVQGNGNLLKSFADKLGSIRGVKHSKLTMATTGKAIPTKSEYHNHHHDE